EETVRLPLAQDAKRCPLPLGLVVGIAEHELVPALARRLLRAADDRRKEWVGDVRDEHPESARPSQAQAASDRGRPVLEPLDRGEHPAAGLGAQGKVRAVERPGHGRWVNSGEASDISDGPAWRLSPPT